MKYVATRPFSITIKGKRTDYRTGDALTESKRKQLSTRLQQFTMESRKWAALKRAKYTPDEYAFIAKSYVNHVNPDTQESCEAHISNLFDLEFAGHDHGAASVIMVICQIKQVDTLYPATGLAGASATLMGALEDVAPGRFIK